MIMTYYCIIIVPKSLSFRCAVAALISHFHVVTLWIGGISSRQPGDIRQYVPSQAEERTKQREQPDSPIKTYPLTEVPRSDYQEQGEVEMTDLGYGIQQFKTWFQITSPSIRFGPISWHRSRSSGSR